MTSLPVATIVAALLGADEKSSPSATVDGHKLRLEKVATSMAGMQNARPVNHLSVTFALDPKDATKSFAYEFGQRFVARDAAGKEIPLGRVPAFGSREPILRLAGYPPSAKVGLSNPFGDPMTIRLPVLSPNATTLATLEGDLFVSDVELLEFVFTKEDFNLDTVKKSGAAEAKLFLFDEGDHGVDIGFKLKLPVRSSAEALTGGSHGFGRDQFLLFAAEAGRKSRLSTSNSRSGGGRGEVEGDSRVRSEIEFHHVDFSRKPDALHLVIPLIDYPRRHVFQLKDISIPPPPPRPGRPGGGIALNRN